jgi:transposase-like protein
MESERDLYLNKSQDLNKANGHYNRSLAAGSFNLNVDVPRDRKGSFRPNVLPEKYKRTDSSYTDLLASLVVNGYSDSQINHTLRQLGLPYSTKDMDLIKEQIQERLNDFKQKELPDKVFALFIDGYHCKIKEQNKVRKACLYSVVGIDISGQRELYGFYTFFAAENKSDWLKVFADLIDRGVKKAAVIVSDDFSGIHDAIETAFPYTKHQLCYVHLMRNCKKYLSKTDNHAFVKELQSIKSSTDFSMASERFDTLCSKYKPSYKAFISNIIQKKDSYLSFMNFSENIRKFIYTTNVVECVNSRIEAIRQKLGGYFQSLNTLETNYFLQIERLHNDKWRLPAPLLASNVYEILQVFNLIFNHTDT